MKLSIFFPVWLELILGYDATASSNTNSPSETVFVFAGSSPFSCQARYTTTTFGRLH